MTKLPNGPLSKDAIEEIIDYLHSKGGVYPLGQLSAHFMGLKKAHLEALKPKVTLKSVGMDGHWQVVLQGHEAQEGAEIVVDGIPCLKTDPRANVSLSSWEVEQITTKISESPEQFMTFREIQREFSFVLRRQQLEGHFKLTRVKDKKFKVSLISAGEENSEIPSIEKRKLPVITGPLPKDILEEIIYFLQLHGGNLSLGKLCAQFMGLKKAHLEKRRELQISRVGPGQWDVRVVGDTPGTHWEIGDAPEVPVESTTVKRKVRPTSVPIKPVIIPKRARTIVEE